MLDFGILGMNARNLQYIKKFNPKKAIRLADNKYKTKRFLSQRDIPVPETYKLIRNRNELYEFDFSKLPTDEFMVKPNKGSRGRGIKRVQLVEDAGTSTMFPSVNILNLLFSRQSPFPDQRYKMSGEYVDDMSFRRYLMDILDGKNSLSTVSDQILIEEVLKPGSGFEAFCTHGLADARVIVFNLIPIIGYVRVPTAKSDGKANLARGANALGVEVGSGKIVSCYDQGKTYTKKFPEPYTEYAHTHVPYWDDILLYSSKVQYLANLGFFALDWVITDDGPKLLEINARAGLKIQNVLGIPLRQRLEKIGDVKVTSPEKGVEIAQTLFTLHKAPVVTMSKVIHLSQHGKFTISKEKGKETHDIIIEVNLDKKSNSLPPELAADALVEGVKTQLLFEDQKIKLNNLKWKTDKNLGRNTIVLGREAVADYYVKPINKVFTSLKFIDPKHIAKSEIDDLHILDQKLSRMGKILNTSRILKPVNYFDELDNFLTWNGRYNPRFKYRRPAKAKLQELEDELLYLRDNYFTHGGLQCDFSKLFGDKIGELLDKVMLLRAYRSQDFAAIQAANEALFGVIQPDLVELSRYTIAQTKATQEYLLGKKLTQTEVRDYIYDYLKKKGHDNIKLDFDGSTTSRMSVIKGKNITVKVSMRAEFREHELEATLAHEIDVHVQRYLNGIETGWDLLKSGTAKYITDEEGLAIYMSEKYLPDGYEKLGRYTKYYLLSEADKHSFTGLIDMIMQMDIGKKSLTKSFKGALRIKKGIQKTGVVQPGAAYLKDKIYLDGYQRVTQWIEEGGDIEKLMIGKIKIDDLKLII